MPIYIDYEKCNGEGLCYDICPMDVFGWDEEKKQPYLAHYDECQHCGDCFFDCPQKCIEITYPVCLW
ncbi:MAG: ferredoxin family protein [Pseudomonadota bacterium]